jgi:hypothetical protein
VANAQADAPETEAATDSPSRAAYVYAGISTGRHNLSPPKPPWFWIRRLPQ